MCECVFSCRYYKGIDKKITKLYFNGHCFNTGVLVCGYGVTQGEIGGNEIERLFLVKLGFYWLSEIPCAPPCKTESPPEY